MALAEVCAVGSLENTGIAPITQDNGASKNPNDEQKQRSHKKYLPSIDLSTLKALEGTTTSSFTDLAQAVILIDGVPYDKDTLPMSKARKIDFERLIAHYAKLEIYGSRKYHVKSVFRRIEKEIENDIELKIDKKAPYIKSKPLTEAQKEARKAIYKAKKAKEKREALLHAEKVREQAEATIAKLKDD